MHKLFIWDFHGTLEKGTEKSVIEVSNIILEKHGYKELLTDEDNRHLFGRKWFEYFSHVLPDESIELHKKLEQECFDFCEKYIDVALKYTQQNDYAADVLTAIEKKHDQILISNTKTEHLRFFLQKTKLDHFFSRHRRFATHDHLDRIHTKQEILQAFLSEHKQYSQFVAIGDSPDDIHVTKGLSSTSYLYVHPGQSHRIAEANYRIHDLREVLREV